ncbi:MAG: hypothetical protein LW878_11390 [Proteobacteria bacterium]|jgi:hypothetical protein|nr:hypothetical protein [Pseudomonadota bacterium]
MLLVKLMAGLRLSMATLMVTGLFTSTLQAQEVKYFSCKGNCLAQKALKGLGPYPLDLKTKLSNPLGSDVCLKQLKGLVVKLKGVDVCQFKDQSAVDLSHLHLYSERLARPTP